MITVSQDNKTESWQSIVPILSTSMSENLMHYFAQSEQIATKVWLAVGETKAAGMLLQKLPDVGNIDLDADAWNRINQLANTVTADELQTLSANTLLSRLFAEEDVRLFEPATVQFHCSCSQTSVASMLHMLGAEELNGILAEFGKIEVNCDFCNRQYVFDAVDTAQLLITQTPVSTSPAKH